MSPLSRIEAQLSLRQSAPPIYDDTLMSSAPVPQSEPELLEQIDMATARWVSQRDHIQSTTRQGINDDTGSNSSSRQVSRSNSQEDRTGEINDRNTQRRSSNSHSIDTDSETNSSERNGISLSITSGIIAFFRKYRSRRNAQAATRRSRSHSLPYLQLHIDNSDRSSIDSSTASTESVMLSATDDTSVQAVPSNTAESTGPDNTPPSTSTTDNDVALISDISNAAGNALHRSGSDESLISLGEERANGDSEVLVNL